jgi:putative FmdB family regulatory protein
MPIYEYRCEACDERFEELLSTPDKPSPPCPSCGGGKVQRLMSRISTEWLPSDVNWHRTSSSWD